MESENSVEAAKRGTGGLTFDPEVELLADTAAFFVGRRACVAPPLRSLNPLQDEALCAHDDASCGIGGQLSALEQPPHVTSVRVGDNLAVQVHVPTLLNLRVFQIAAQLEGHYWCIWDTEK